MNSVRERASIKFSIDIFMGLKKKWKSACYVRGTRESAHCSSSLYASGGEVRLAIEFDNVPPW